MDYKIFAYIGIGLVIAYLALRLMGQLAVTKLVRAELDHVVNHDDHKVKGRFQ